MGGLWPLYDLFDSRVPQNLCSKAGGGILSKNFRRHLYFGYFDTKMSINCILDSLISQTRKFHGGKIVV